MVDKKMAKKAKDSDSIEINAKLFSKFLSKVYLNSLLNECVLHSAEGVVSVGAIDPSNIVFLSIQEAIDLSPFGDLGLGDIQKISKFISDCPDEKLKLVKKENRLSISHSGINIEYLLTDPTLITTSVENGKINEIMENCEYSFTLTKKVKEAFLYSTDLLKVKTASILVDKGQVFLTGGLANEHNFGLDPISLEEGSATEIFTCSYYADYVKAVFSVLDFNTEEEPIIIFSPDYPMIVQEGANYWAVFPLTLD